MQLSNVQFSFAGGEIAPEAQGRADLDKYALGLEECKNFIITPHGAVKNRAGFAHVNRVKDSTKATRLIPFSFNTTIFAAIEFGEYYFRFHSNGQTLLETAVNITDIFLGATTTITAASHGFTAGQWVYLTGIGGTTELNGRYFIVDNVTTNRFDLLDLDSAAVDSTNYTAYTSGGTCAIVHEEEHPYTESQLADVRFSMNGDAITLTHPSHSPRELIRDSSTGLWTLYNATFEGVIDAPSNVSASVVSGTGSTKYYYVVTAVAEDGTHESEPSAPNVGTTVNITGVALGDLSLPFYLAKNISRPVGVFTLNSVSGIAEGEIIGPVASVGGMSGVNGKSYLVESVDTVNKRVYVTRANGKPIDSEYWTGTYTSGGTVNLSELQNNLDSAGAKNRVTYDRVAGASRYRVYKRDKNTNMYGYIGETTKLSFTDENITPDTTQPPPNSKNPFVKAGNYPAACTHFEQRRVFGGTDNGPQFIWCTNSGRDDVMTAAFPPSGSDAFSFRIASKQNNRIIHLVPAQDLLAFTPAAIHRISSAQGALAANDVASRMQASVGSTNVAPVISASAVVFCEAGSKHIMGVAYNLQNQSYEADDFSILASHLFDGYNIVDLAFQRGTSPLVWAVRNDGVLLGMTFLPSQRVAAWHQHTTDGLFEAVCVVQEGSDDILYAVVNRDGVRTVERMPLREDTTVEDCFYLDNGLTYDGAATSTITNLWPLEGKEVKVLADGAYLGEFTVSDGQIDFGDDEYSTVHIGLGYTSRLKTLPFASPRFEGGGFNVVLNPISAHLKVVRSRGIKAGANTDDLYEMTPYLDAPYSPNPELYTGTAQINIDGTWEKGGQVIVEQQYPLPCTITALVCDVARG